MPNGYVRQFRPTRAASRRSDIRAHFPPDAHAIRATRRRWVGSRTALIGLALAAVAMTALPLTASAVPAEPAATAPQVPEGTRIPAGETTALTGLTVSDDNIWRAYQAVTVKVALSVTVGTLTLTQPWGLTDLSGASWSGASLEFAGAVPDVNTALESVTLTLDESADGAATVTLSATPYTFADSTRYFSGSGHFYRFVSAPEIDADAARTNARSTTFLDMTGYLVQIPDQGVSDFLSSTFSSTSHAHAWIGAQATDVALDDGGFDRAWKWVDGPLDGVVFTTCTLPGTGTEPADDCDRVDGRFSNWAADQPDNDGAVGGETAVVTNWERNVCDSRVCWPVGSWNDISPVNNTGYYRGVTGYLVEFGGDHYELPVAQASAVLPIEPVPPVSVPSSAAPTTPTPAPATSTATTTPATTPAPGTPTSTPTAATSSSASPAPAPTPSSATSASPPATPPPPIAEGAAGSDLGVNDPAPTAGQALLLTASGFQPGSTVHFYLHSEPLYLGYGVADADGVARVRVTVPEHFTGGHTVQSVGTGLSGESCNLIHPITVRPQAALASTGVTVGMIGLLAAELLALGVAVLRLEQSRRRTAH